MSSTIDERRALFSTVAAGLETRAENIEKDLYVCWALDFLFNRRPTDPVGLYFKGGTSLSKAYGLTQRFSEDIDIGIYKTDLKVPLEADIAALPLSMGHDGAFRYPGRHRGSNQRLVCRTSAPGVRSTSSTHVRAGACWRRRAATSQPATIIATGSSVGTLGARELG